MHRITRHHRFTLLEVSIAAMLLAISAVGALTVVGTARADILREVRRRDREHHLANAVEFFLLAGPDGVVPNGLLPDGMSATCTVAEVDEGLPEQAYESIQGWRLGEYRITLYGDDGQPLGEQRIRKILKEEEDLGIVSLGAN